MADFEPKLVVELPEEQVEVDETYDVDFDDGAAPTSSTPRSGHLLRMPPSWHSSWRIRAALMRTLGTTQVWSSEIDYASKPSRDNIQPVVFVYGLPNTRTACVWSTATVLVICGLQRSTN